MASYFLTLVRTFSVGWRRKRTLHTTSSGTLLTLYTSCFLWKYENVQGTCRRRRPAGYRFPSFLRGVRGLLRRKALLTRQLLRHEHAAVLSSPMSFPNTRDKERIPCACCYAHGESGWESSWERMDEWMDVLLQC